MIEAHLEGREPIVVTDHASTLNKALDGALEKLISMIDSILGRQRDKRDRKTEQPISELKLPEDK
jgi:hypothetical protein